MTCSLLLKQFNFETLHKELTGASSKNMVFFVAVKVNYTISTAKLHPCSFDVSAAAEASSSALPPKCFA
jgi:hypothetical protein